MPVVADVKSALRFPGDPRNWKNADVVMAQMEDAILNGGYKVPSNLLKDVESAHVQRGGIEKNLIPMWKDKGFDSVLYPHAGSKRYDSFMTFDPGQMAPKYSPKGQELIQQRGLHEPNRLSWDSGLSTPEPWRVPAGVLKKYGDSDPADFGKVSAKYQKEREDYQKRRYESLAKLVDEGTMTQEDFKKAREFWKLMDME
jgi:hypothetical protein